MGEWRRYTVAEIAAPGKHSLATGPFGSAIASRHFQDSGIPVIRGANLSLDVGTRLRDDGLVFVSEDKAAEFQRSMAKRGDLVFTCWGTIGQVGLIDERAQYSRYVISNKQMKLTLDPGVAHPRFAYYAFSSPAMISQVQGASIGSSVPGFNLTQLRLLSLEFPPLCEQRAIAEVLGALDDKIALNERIAATSLELAQSQYIQRASISEDWREWKLKDVATWFSGGTPKTSEPSYWNGGIPWISASSLKSPWISESARTLTPLGVANGTRLAPEGAILFVVRGMSLTTEFRIGVAQRELAFGQDCKALTPHPFVDSTTLFLAIRGQSQKVLDMVDLAGHGTGRLVTERIANLLVRLPQGEASSQFTVAVGSLARTAASVMKENRTLADLRDTLLPQLVTGKLRVKDAIRAVEEYL